ncbi:hypothetical protein MTO96_036268 [Rhipicephalus appendiculatus]
MYHILLVGEAIHALHCSQHNFIYNSVANKLQSHYPDADISTDHLLVARCGTSLWPEIAVDIKEKTFVLDATIAWDARTETLEAMFAHKSEKYTPFLPLIRQCRPQYKVKVLGLEFGAHGLLCQSTKQAAKEIG